MIISHKLKFIFIHIQRTGGSTVIYLLKNLLREEVEIVSQHGNAATSEKSLLDKYNDYFTYTVVRNPWDRILSWYLLINKQNHLSLAQERMKFEEFVELDHSALKGDAEFHYNQLDYFSNENGDILIDKCYRFENFESEVKTMFKDLGLQVGDIPKLNESLEIDYREYYTAKSQELIAQKCSKDISHFGFEF